jgi:hypothetical protein
VGLHRAAVVAPFGFSRAPFLSAGLVLTGFVRAEA